jgi:hypothetical protein
MRAIKRDLQQSEVQANPTDYFAPTALKETFVFRFLARWARLLHFAPLALQSSRAISIRNRPRFKQSKRVSLVL